MNKQVESKLKEFQKFINYKFNNSEILLQALTTPQFGNENDLPHYEILETLGDAVIKLIFSLKIYNKGEEDPGKLTKTKQCLESNRTFSKIALNMRLNSYIFSSKKQRVKGTSILADVFEAICGALYIDSDYSLKLVEQKIIDRFIENWDLFIEESSTFYKSELLEFLQNKLKLTPNIRYDYEKLGPQHNLRWIAKNPKFFDQDEKEIIKIPLNLESRQFNTKKDAEKELSEIILRYLKENNNLFEKV